MRKRRTMLFVPGNNPGMLQSAPVLGADAVIFDLEDAVALAEKDAARILVRNALMALDTMGRETVVRVNALDTPFWREDIAAIVPAGVHTVLLAKCGAPADVHTAVDAIAAAEKACGRPHGDVGLILLLESALGVENAFAIASAHDRVEGLFFGAEDFCADMGAQRTATGEEIAYARGRVVVAAKAARVDAIDTPFTAVDDLENLERDARLGRQMGFDGKAVISPQHVRIVNRVFMPTEAEITWAGRIKAAMEQGVAEGKGAVSLDGNMVDGPIVKRALGILRACGLLEED
ncbi:MAG: CoA ester lyase [Desulfovibrionaceae bacterium]